MGMGRADPRLQFLACPSAALAGIANALGVTWLQAEIRPINRIAVVDIATGQRLPNLWQGGDASHHAPAITPDGEFLLVADGEAGVIAIRTSTGRRHARVAARVPSFTFPTILPIAQFTGDRPLAYLVTLDESAVQTHLIAWDLQANRLQVVARAECYVDTTFPVGRQAMPRWFSVADDHGAVLAVSSTGFGEAYAGTLPGLSVTTLAVQRRVATRLHELSQGVSRPLAVSGSFNTPMLLTDAGLLVNFPEFFDVHSGVSTSDARPDSDDLRLSYSLATSAINSVDLDHSSRLVVFASFQSIYTYDIDTRQWASQLSHPDRYIAPVVSARTCARWIAACPFRSAGPTGPYIRALLLYDIQPLRDQIAREDAWRAEKARPSASDDPR